MSPLTSLVIFCIILIIITIEHHFSPRIYFTRTKCILFYNIKDKFGATFREQKTLFNL